MTLRYDCGEVITAMVTPMDKTGAIDYDKVEALTKHLISTGSDTLLVAGTSGESPTLTNEEEIELVSTVKRAAANKAKIILGAGSNSTESAIEYSKFAQKKKLMLFCLLFHTTTSQIKEELLSISLLLQNQLLCQLFYTIFHQELVL